VTRWVRPLLSIRFWLWLIALVLAVAAPFSLFHGPANEELRQHPVNARATVTDVYVNGFGGDPTVDYQFTVDGQTYIGSGTGGELGNGNVLELKPGSTVAIQYAAFDPSLSCTCDARTADDWRLPTTAFNAPALLEFVPLLGMTAWEIQRRIGRKRLGQKPSSTAA
jgi:hypothetical protein